MTEDYSTVRLFMIDDDLMMQKQVEITAKSLGVKQIEFSDNGADAIKRISDGEVFDLLLLDLNMPVMDGIETMRHLSSLQYTGAIALFSGEDSRIMKTAENLASVHNLHLAGTISKPATKEALLEVLSCIQQKDVVTDNYIVSLESEEALAKAIASKEIVPFFQPRVNTVTKKIESVEALARWIHRDKGIISPICFIPVAESSELIFSLTESIIEQSLEHIQYWKTLAIDVEVSINLSPLSLNDIELPESMARYAESRGVPCHRIVFEITESRLMENLSTSLDVLTRLRLKGFGLSIDDFGTGYSSMAQLKQIPFTELKIDRAFVHGVHSDPAAQAILESSAVLAKKLDMAIVAEGVEDEVDWQSVINVGADLVQGYFIAKPMSAKNFIEWYQDYNKNID